LGTNPSECQAAMEELGYQYDDIIAEATTEAARINKAATDKAKKVAADVKAERTAWEKEKAQLARTLKFEKIIKLNVGGKKFSTSLATLRRFPDSMLAAMFSGRHAVPTDEEGYYFVDQDGTHFEEILNFLRSPETYTVNLPPAELSKLKQQCKFYGLLQDMFPFIPASPMTVYNRCGDSSVVTQDNTGLWYVDRILMSACYSCGSGLDNRGYIIPNFTNGTVKRALYTNQPAPSPCPCCGTRKS
jgi:hypothetical protein